MTTELHYPQPTCKDELEEMLGNLYDGISGTFVRGYPATHDSPEEPAYVDWSEPVDHIELDTIKWEEDFVPMTIQGQAVGTVHGMSARDQDQYGNKARLTIHAELVGVRREGFMKILTYQINGLDEELLG